MRDQDGVPYIIVERGNGGGTGAFLVGALLGAGIALLLAPRSGEETQQDLKERAYRLRDSAEEKVREAQQQVEQRLEQARAEVMERVEHIREAVESGKTTAQEARVELEEKLDRSKAAYRAGIEAAREVARGEGEPAEGEAG